MTEPAGENPHPRWRTRRYRMGALVLVLAVLGGGALWVHRTTQQRLQARLLQTAPDSVSAHPDLMAFAIAAGRPLYATHCASCHGADLHGNPATGAPNLADQVWLYGKGSVFDIERTVLYGIRSGMAKTRDVTDMPAFGLTGMLAPDEIRNLVQYVLQLSGAKHDPQSALAGKQLYSGNANCGDCHGPDGRGDTTYGAPDLTTNVWNSGGDAQSLYNTIYHGQHHMMPGFIKTLGLEQIRALAVYIHASSVGGKASASPAEPYGGE